MIFHKSYPDASVTMSPDQSSIMNQSKGQFATLHRSSEVIFIIAFVVRHFNVILHGIGCCLLWILVKRNSAKPQVIFLYNLIIYQLVRNIVPLPIMYSRITGSRLLIPAMPYFILNFRVTFEILFYLLMILVTVDRLLVVLLSVKYRDFCSMDKAKKILVLVWTICGMIGVITCVLYHFGKIGVDLSPYNHYIRSAMDIIFIILSILVYTILLRWNVNSLAHRLNLQRARRSRLQMLRASNFHFFLVIITTFILFVFSTDVIDIVCHFAGLRVSFTWPDVRLLIFSISDLADGLTYIFLHNKLRKIFTEKIRCCFCCHDNATRNGETFDIEQRNPGGHGNCMGTVRHTFKEEKVPRETLMLRIQRANAVLNDN